MKKHCTIKRLACLAVIALVLCIGAKCASADRYDAGSRTVIMKTATGDGSGNGQVAITGTDLTAVKGRVLYTFVTIPGTGAQQPAAWAGSIDAASQGLIMTIPTRSTTLTQSLPGFYTLGRFPEIVSGWTATLTGIGEGNTVTVQFIFW